LLGEKQRSEPMFYYVKVEDLIPEGHLLKLVDRHIDCTFMRAKVKHLYSHTGRPSIDPEVLLRMLFIGYLYGITSERGQRKNITEYKEDDKASDCNKSKGSSIGSGRNRG